MKADLISIEDGFQIIMLFLQKFWWTTLKEIIPQQNTYSENSNDSINQTLSLQEDALSEEIIEDNEFFFLIVCIGSSSDDYFETVVERRMNIPPLKQHDGLVVRKELLFQLAIDFCSYFNERFQENGNDSLRFAINWLEDMQKHPKKHKNDLVIWNQVIVDVTQHGAKSLGFF